MGAPNAAVVQYNIVVHTVYVEIFKGLKFHGRLVFVVLIFADHQVEYIISRVHWFFTFSKLIAKSTNFMSLKMFCVYGYVVV